MVVDTAAMEPATLVVVIVVTSVASLAGLVILVMMCTCCYDKTEEDEYKSYEPISTSEPERTSWRNKWLLGKAPVMFKQTIKFKKPDKTVSVENVQPDSASQTSLNESLRCKNSENPSEHRLSNLFPSDAARRQSMMPAEGSHVALARTESGQMGSAGHINTEEDYPNQGLGRIQFCIEYDFHEGTLVIKVHRATDLPAKDFSGTSDPYVKVILLPDKRHKLETKVRKKCLNPTWNEIFCFEGFPYNKLDSKTLLLQVMDFDRFSRDDVIGDVVIPLASVDVVAAPTMWRYIQQSSKSRGKLGELLVSMCYQPTAGRLSVVILKARDLKAKDMLGSSDPYVKIWLMHKGKKIEKKKTHVHKCTLTPVFNESFMFDVPLEKIRDSSLLVSVMDFDKMGRNELIGKFVLGSHSGPLEKKHWSEMLHKTRTQVAQWHLLKD